jgi:hypothetical protein
MAGTISCEIEIGWGIPVTLIVATALRWIKAETGCAMSEPNNSLRCLAGVATFVSISEESH